MRSHQAGTSTHPSEGSSKGATDSALPSIDHEVVSS